MAPAIPPMGIFRVVGVTLRAVRFGSVLLSVFAPERVLLLRDRFHVPRVDAVANPTEMVDVESVWDWAH